MEGMNPMRDPKLNPVDILPLVAGLIDAGLAHAKELLVTLTDPAWTSFERTLLLVGRMLRFLEDISEFHAAFEKAIDGRSPGPETSRELARLRGVVNHLRALSSESQQFLDRMKARNKVR